MIGGSSRRRTARSGGRARGGGLRQRLDGGDPVRHALALPSGLAGLVAFYAAYGLLALVPGANPDASSSSGSCAPSGACQWSSTGDLASWFQFTTDAIGVFALTTAAITNVLVAHWLLTRSRRTPSRSAADGAP